MPAPLEATMPQYCDLADGYVVRLAALDPTTGAAIPNVNVQSVSIYALNLGGGTGENLEYGPWQLVPGPGA